MRPSCIAPVSTLPTSSCCSTKRHFFPLSLSIVLLWLQYSYLCLLIQPDEIPARSNGWSTADGCSYYWWMDGSIDKLRLCRMWVNTKQKVQSQQIYAQIPCSRCWMEKKKSIVHCMFALNDVVMWQCQKEVICIARQSWCWWGFPEFAENASEWHANG